MLTQSMEYAHASGQPWDPANPFEFWPSIDAQAERLFERQDAEIRRAERLAAREAGLEHLLPSILSLRSGEVTSSVPESGHSAPVPAARTLTLDKVRELLHRGGPVSCMCPSCVHVRASRTEESR
jgi:hypothetical protein